MSSLGVRREKVVLELDDQLSSGMVRAAASSALLDKALDRSSGSVRRFGNDTDRAGKEIDKLSGRMRIFADIAAILGPTISPLGASLVTPLVGLTNQLGFAALAGGTAVLAFQGVGDALKAMNEYGLDPSAANAEKLDEKMGKLDATAQDFVQTLHDLGPEISRLRAAAAGGMIPGLTEALDSLETRLPEFEGIISTVSRTLGDLVAEGADALASGEWDEWFATVEREGKPALEDMGHTVGELTAGLAGLWQATLPLSRDFSSGLLDMSRDFHAWADGLDESQGFEDFLQYVRESGPQVRAALGAIANMLVQILQAAAPLGGPILRGIEAFADAVALIADSDIGTPIFAGLAALAAYNRIIGLATLANKSFASSRLAMGAAQRSGLTTMRADAKSFMAFGAMTRAEVAAQQAAGKNLRSTFIKGAAGAAGLALAMSPIPEKVGLSNAAMGTMMGMLAGPWGAAVGGGVGLLMDMSAANKEVADSERRTTDAIKSGSQERIAARKAELEAERESQKNSALAGFRKAFAFMGPDEGFSKSDKTAADIDRINAAQAKTRAEAAATAAALAATYGQPVARVATMSLEDFSAAIERVNGLLSKEASIDAYEAALDATTASLKENGRTLDNNTKAGRANRAALRDQAQAAIEAAEKMKPLKGARFLRKAKQDFIDAQTAMGKGEVAAKRLARKLFDIPKNPKTKVDVETRAAMAAAEALRAKIAALPKSQRIVITTVMRNIRENIAGQGANLFFPGQSADGGSVPKTGLPYADRHPYLLADGEEVISNRYGQADRHRALLKAINAGMLADGGTVRGLASGGTAKNRFTRAEYNRAAGNFDLKLGQSVAEVRRELRTFSREVKRAGGHVGKDFGKLSKRAQNVARSLERNSAALDTWRSKQADARAGAASAFNNDPFKGTLADMRLQLEADRNDSRSLASLTANLRGKGAKNDFLAGITGSGNLELVKELASASKSQLLSYQSLYGQRASAQASAGAQAAAGYNVVVGQLNGLVKRQTAVLDKLEGRVQAGAKKGVQANKKATKAKGKRK